MNKGFLYSCTVILHDGYCTVIRKAVKIPKPEYFQRALQEGAGNIIFSSISNYRARYLVKFLISWNLCSILICSTTSCWHIYIFCRMRNRSWIHSINITIILLMELKLHLFGLMKYKNEVVHLALLAEFTRSQYFENFLT